MLPWALTLWVFAIFAALAALLRSGGIVAGGSNFARVFLFSLLVLCSTTLVYGLVTGRRVPASITVRTP